MDTGEKLLMPPDNLGILRKPFNTCHLQRWMEELTITLPLSSTIYYRSWDWKQILDWINLQTDLFLNLRSLEVDCLKSVYIMAWRVQCVDGWWPSLAPDDRQTGCCAGWRTVGNVCLAWWSCICQRWRLKQLSHSKIRLLDTLTEDKGTIAYRVYVRACSFCHQYFLYDKKKTYVSLPACHQAGCQNKAVNLRFQDSA